MLREINKTICSIWKLVSLLLKGNLEKETYFKSIIIIIWKKKINFSQLLYKWIISVRNE